MEMLWVMKDSLDHQGKKTLWSSQAISMTLAQEKPKGLAVLSKDEKKVVMKDTGGESPSTGRVIEWLQQGDLSS